jgi:hypothetical protein
MRGRKDTPGHCIGHMCGLARTTAGEQSTFLLLGGDVCHFVGDLRPNPAYRIPDEMSRDILDEDPEFFPQPCPCSLFTNHHPQLADNNSDDQRRHTPFFKVSTLKASAYIDPSTAQRSVDNLMHFEQSPDVMVCLAHDRALFKFLPTFNDDARASLNDWKSKGWKEKCRWDWLNELPRNGKPGRKKIVDGFWRDGKPWDRAQTEA